jgi:hypothetical protein
MGKRELLIAVAFLLVGLVAYQLTAPPPKEGEQGFSLSRIFSHMRREIRGNPSRGTFKHEGTFPVPASVTEVRITPGRSVTLVVTGEERDDVAYEMPVDSSGPDEATATGYAKKSKLFTDDLGSSLSFRIEFPEEAQQTASLSLRVPARLAVRIEGNARARVNGVRSVHLGNAAGEITLEGITGAVSGAHRTGDLVVGTAGSATLTLQSSRAKFRAIQQGLTLNVRSGACEVHSSQGPLEVTAMNAETTISHHGGPVQVGGEGGTVRVVAPVRETKIDMRRTEVNVELAAAAAVTALTTDEPLRIVLADTAGVEVDASASDGGQVQAGEFALQPEKQDRASRLTHVFGDKPQARVVLRNVRGDIVIGKRK